MLLFEFEEIINNFQSRLYFEPSENRNYLLNFKIVDEKPEYIEDYTEEKKILNYIDEFLTENKSNDEVKEFMEKLISFIDLCSDSYYNKGFSIIDDKTFDIILKKLEEIENKYKISSSNSPTKKVGYKINGDEDKFIFPKKLLSLQNTYNQEDILKWVEMLFKTTKNNFTILKEPKYDGLAITLIYVNGRLDKMVTRGNGEVGKIINKEKYLKNVPYIINHQDYIMISGEVIISETEFSEINEDNNFANPRNFTAGQMLSKEIKEEYFGKFTFKPYDINPNIYDTIVENKKFLKSLGFEPTEYEFIKTFDNLVPFKNDFPMDGLVFKINEIKLRDIIGYTSKFPKWAVAYKFDPEAVKSVLRDVKWFIGKTGKLTPVGIIDSVEVSRTMVTNVNLYNYPEIENLNLKIGSGITVVKCAEIIPRIKSVIDSNGYEIEKPTNCPYCGSKLEEIGPELYCVNKYCTEKMKLKMIFFASKNGMDIKGCGTKIVEFLFNNGYIRYFNDFFELYKFKDEELIKKEIGINFNKILDEIEKAKSKGLRYILRSLSIPEIGDVAARTIESRVKDWNELYNIVMYQNKNITDPKKYLGIGEVAFNNLKEFLSLKYNIEMILKFINCGVNLKSTFDNSNKKDFKGKVVITGTFQVSRIKLIKALQDEGYEVVDTVSNKIDFLICGQNPGSKLAKAKKLNIPIKDESDSLVYNIIENLQ